MALPEIRPFKLSSILSQFDQGQQTGRDNAARSAFSEFGQDALGGNQEAINELFKFNPEVAAQLQQLAQNNEFKQAQLRNANRPKLAKPPTGFTFNDPTNPAAGVKPIPGFIEGQTLLNKAKATNVNVTNKLPPVEKEEQKATGKFFGEQFTTTQKAGTEARSVLSNVARFEQLSENVDTGNVEQALLPLKKAFVSMGFATQEQIDQVANLEGLMSLGTEFALNFVQGTKGAVSDAEMALFLQAAPNIGNSPEGNQLILDKTEVIAQNQIEIAKLQRRYRQGKSIVIDGQTFKAPRNGTVEGFQDVVDAFHTANPLFSAEEQQQLQSGAFVGDDTTGQQTQGLIPGQSTATGPNGEKIVWDGSQWVPLTGGQ